MSGLAAFLMALPLWVYVLGGVLALRDGGSRVRTLLTLSLRLALVLLLAVLTRPDGRLWIVAAGGLILALHAGAQLAGRYVVRSGRWPTERDQG